MISLQKAGVATFLLAFSLLTPPAMMRPVAAQEVSSATTISNQEDPKTQEIKKQLQKYYDEMGEGFARFDVIEATKYFSADYRSVGKTGNKTTRAQMREIYKRIVGQALRTQMTTEITVCTVQGDTATVQTKKLIRGVVRDSVGQNGLIEGDALSRDFWMKRKGIWQLKQTRSFDFNIRINGQTIFE